MLSDTLFTSSKICENFSENNFIDATSVAAQVCDATAAQFLFFSQVHKNQNTYL